MWIQGLIYLQSEVMSTTVGILKAPPFLFSICEVADILSVEKLSAVPLTDGGPVKIRAFNTLSLKTWTIIGTSSDKMHVCKGLLATFMHACHILENGDNLICSYLSFGRSDKPILPSTDGHQLLLKTHWQTLHSVCSHVGSFVMEVRGLQSHAEFHMLSQTGAAGRDTTVSS